MEIEELVWHLGGVATRRQLVATCSRPALDEAVRAGRIVRSARGRYTTLDADHDRRIAHSMRAALSHRSAAHAHGWALLHRPPAVEVIVPRTRRVRRHLPGVAVRWGPVTSHELDDGRTSVRTTLRDCLRSLPFPEALAIADSALRERDVTKSTLVALADSVQGPGAKQARRVAGFADGCAANPFESGLRAIALDVPGLNVEPQIVVLQGPGGRVVPDLVDRRLRLAIEAESFEFHGKRQKLRLDTKRVNRLLLDGWLVIRFAWEDVMFDPDYVRRVLIEVVEMLAHGHAHCGRCRGHPA